MAVGLENREQPSGANTYMYSILYCIYCILYLRLCGWVKVLVAAYILQSADWVRERHVNAFPCSRSVVWEGSTSRKTLECCNKCTNSTASVSIEVSWVMLTNEMNEFQAHSRRSQDQTFNTMFPHSVILDELSSNPIRDSFRKKLDAKTYGAG